jgi:hypothetical protein
MADPAESKGVGFETLAGRCQGYSTSGKGMFIGFPG